MKEIIAIIIILVALSFLVISIFFMKRLSKKSTEIIDRLSKIIDKAETLEEVNNAWNQLENECTSKGYKEGKRFFNLSPEYRQDYIELNTVCRTKFKILIKDK